MEFPTSRRINATYGRPTKRVLVHNLFATQDTIFSLPDVKFVARASPPATTSNAQVLEQAPNGPSMVPQEETPVVPRPEIHTHRERQTRPYRPQSTHAGVQDDVFTVSSSESEVKMAKAPPKLSKKQRIVHTSSTSSTQTTRPIAKLISRSRIDESVPISSTTTAQPLARQSSSKGLKVRQLRTSLSVNTEDHNNVDDMEIVTGRQSPEHASFERRNTSYRRASKDQHTSARTKDEAASSRVGCASSSSSESTTSVSTSTKRKRTPLARATPEPSSPSMLGLTPLKLKPDGSDTASVRSSPEPTTGPGRKGPRTRPRMIDRLDAPSRSQPSVSFGSELTVDSRFAKPSTPRGSSNRGRLKATKTDDAPQQQQPASNPERSRESQTRVTYATKARTTYAKERSHLSDMVGNLDLPDVGTGSQPHEKTSWMSTTSNLASQLDLDDDDSDAQVGTKSLKSIHELRQAGAITRSDRDIQAIFEDIEMTQGKKKARLPALTKLARRLGDDIFLHHFLSNGRVTRLTRCASKIASAIEGVPYTIALYHILKSTTAAETLAQLLDGIVAVVPRMLLTGDSLEELIAQKDKHISKIDVKDLTDLEQEVIRRKLMPGYEGDNLSPDSLALFCLDEILRRMMQLRGEGITIPATVYSGILSSLARYAERLKSHVLGPSQASFIGKALSVLELCSLGLNTIEASIEDEQYVQLGESLSTIKLQTTDEEGNIERGILRAVVSLSNNNTEMCRLLGKSSIIDTILAVVDTNFGTIAEHADHHREIDEKRLDSVILALGCLLNFAECDGDSRRRIAFGNAGSQSYVNRLVTLFNSQIAKAREATTAEEGQVLVAFGYLSMLLCTMSLDPEVKRHITQHLQDKSFDELCSAAELFFSHLRTLENISDDDPSMKSFTERFSGILQSIRGRIHK